MYMFHYSTYDTAHGVGTTVYAAFLVTPRCTMYIHFNQNNAVKRRRFSTAMMRNYENPGNFLPTKGKIPVDIDCEPPLGLYFLWRRGLCLFFRSKVPFSNVH